MRRTPIFLSLLLLLAVTSASGEVSYSNFDSKGWSRSRHISDKSQIALCLNLISHGFQRQNLWQVAAAACPELSSGSIDSLINKYESSFSTLIAEGQDFLPTTQTGSLSGTINAFSWFGFDTDSVVLSGRLSTAYVHGRWLTPQAASRGEGQYVFTFSKTCTRWHPDNVGAVFAAAADYLNQTSDVLRLRAEDDGTASRDLYDDYSEFLSFSSKHLLLEREIMSEHPRFTEAVALVEYGERFFSCLGQPGLFHYEGDDPIIGNLSVTAIADPCWQRFVVGNYVPDEESEWFIWARGRMGEVVAENRTGR